MKISRKILAIAVIAFSLSACSNNKQEPSQKTGQEDGMNTIDSTHSQTTDSVAPGSRPHGDVNQGADADTMGQGNKVQ